MLSFFFFLKVACTEWLKVFRWIDGQADWTEPRHVKHGLNVLQQFGVKRGNHILNRYLFLCSELRLALGRNNRVGCACERGTCM